ncbi:MAG: hypothetical protein AB4060_07970 [Crocosphaera sp.]
MNIDLVSVKQGIEILSPVIVGSAGLIWDATQKKFVAKAGEQVSSAMLEQINNVFNKLRNKSPDNADKLEAAINSDDVIDAEVVKNNIEEAANIDEDVKKELEKLGKMIQENSEAKQVIENWKGINIKGGVNTIQNNTLNFD